PGGRSEAAICRDDMRLSQPTVVPKYFSAPAIRSFTESSENQLSKISLNFIMPFSIENGVALRLND
ncbi:MAG: hypothetical protein NTZ26_10025, partial [Candidatus Aminicenantes bacterium]|nr:hypothetical protein [Candidatus Aminicenantes bacterium]